MSALRALAVASREAALVVRRAVATPGSVRRLHDGSEPVPAMDPRKQGSKGVGDKPYEVERFKQDGPPPGGFPPIDTERKSTNTPNIPSWAIIGLTISMMGYGFYGVWVGNRERRALKLEKWFIRTTMLPLVQSEEDVKFLARQAKKRAREAEIMKDVPGWKVGESVYHSKRWVEPPLNAMNFNGRWGPLHEE
eukprot:CAMPEP_0173391904 /NCGR_PEP_ID=MMETSP1356-20130122/18648_1 /TAXON_ID=77927 ORGANISM="Hemiselmis virescens, Strain PCC157" /NCGR_SAMPLE_ID=MMETSP1356 /ASSEMBLY_ACC=CAM_ASM_000847 /LENGTH=192 /DNA_ID=CAMNT_0014349599 /DNA_START=8 /DNA_END=586 /DNA_ORIENTATION=+